MIFQESKIAHGFLDGLKGIEIGGSAHNPFGLDTINIDITDSLDTVYKKSEIQLCGRALNVDIVSPGDNLPFKDKSYDFVISSHVIEHFFDPIKAIKEWLRVARKYVFMIVPEKTRTFDRDRPVTPISEIHDRYLEMLLPDAPNGHFTVWTGASFLEMCKFYGFDVVFYADVDDKVGNGFVIVLRAG